METLAAALAARHRESPTLVVRTGDDLRSLPSAASLILRRPRVQVRVQQMDESEVRGWEARFEALRFECGCTAGAIGLGTFLLLSVVVAVLDTSSAPDDLRAGVFLVQAGLFAGGLVLSALLGKLAGLSLAAVRFRRAFAALERRLAGLQSTG